MLTGNLKFFILFAVVTCEGSVFSVGFVFLLSPDGAHSDESTPDPSQAIYAEFDDDFEDEELSAPIGKCTAMYNFPGMSQAAGLSAVLPVFEGTCVRGESIFLKVV